MFLTPGHKMTILLYAYKSKLQLFTALSIHLQHVLKIFIIILIIVRSTVRVPAGAVASGPVGWIGTSTNCTPGSLFEGSPWRLSGR